MKRRELIKTISIGSIGVLTGCSAPKKEERPQPTGVTEPTKAPTPPPSPEYRSSIQVNSENFPLDYTVSLSENEYSGDNPITATVSLTNNTEKTHEFMDSRKAFFIGETSENTQYVSYPFAENYEGYVKNNCWSRKNFFGMSQELVKETIEPDETITRKIIIAIPESVKCPNNPPETITITSSVTYGENLFINNSAPTTLVTLQLQKIE